jgi:hypothetical protein
MEATINKALGITVALILLAYLILPIAGDLVTNGNWTAIGIPTGLATGLMIIVVIIFLFSIIKTGGKRS